MESCGFTKGKTKFLNHTDHKLHKSKYNINLIQINKKKHPINSLNFFSF